MHVFSEYTRNDGKHVGVCCMRIDSFTIAQRTALLQLANCVSRVRLWKLVCRLMKLERFGCQVCILSQQLKYLVFMLVHSV